MERSVIRGQPIPDYAALHPGCQVGATFGSPRPDGRFEIGPGRSRCLRRKTGARTAGDVRRGDPAFHTSLTTANISLPKPSGGGQMNVITFICPPPLGLGKLMFAVV